MKARAVPTGVSGFKFISRSIVATPQLIAIELKFSMRNKS